MTTTLRTWLDQAWDQHPDQPQAVADRLAEGIGLLADGTAPAEELARFGEHLLLGHLDQAQPLRDFIAAMQPVAGRDEAVTRVLQRAALGLVLAGHDAGSGPELPADEQLRAMGQAMLAHTRRADRSGARQLLDRARSLAAQADEPKCWRALAIITNNLAGDLRYYRVLAGGAADPQGDVLMLEAAALARRHWATTGGWVEVERADYQLALCHAAACQGEAALQHARNCLAGCEANQADAYELFFAHEALAIAHSTLLREQRSRMAAKLEMLDDAGARAYAQATLAKLDERISKS
ncbi:MAG: hypothetical protein IV092_03395 [Burkholderiaceae bacterium]|nr:hypothetical protein [Burkholderiaceae bacterium]